ncbi:MAG: hypothetical protein GXO76_02055, partial [Calditrichaeota bacterium]|nr:hypothetical protein [Calditrichota bacterium]
MKRMTMAKRILTGIVLVAVLFLHTTGYTASRTVWLVSLNASPQIRFGVQQLRLSLEKRQVAVKLVQSPATSQHPRIWVGLASDFAKYPRIGRALKELPSKSESFLIRKSGKNEVTVIGRDATGALYGLLELADQADLAEGRSFSFACFREKISQPFLALRGVNPFLHVQALLDTASWYFSDEFWADYLNRLARTRHNFLDIHAAYDLTKTNMPNIFPFFFTDPVVPHIVIRVGREQKPVELTPRQ